MGLIDVQNISFSYSRKKIFEDISFSINKGEIFCLLGPNGCGKSTLLDCILGIINPCDGEILSRGEKTTSLKSGERARLISYVPQKHEGTFPYSVLDMTLMGRAAYISPFSSPSKKDIFIAEEALSQVGILELKNRSYTKLSGGESQLVLIARALAQKTPVIIMDEPTSHLDFRHEFLVLETITELVKKKNISIIMATHFPNHPFYFEGNNIKTRVAMLGNGGFIKTGTPDDVLTKDNIKELYGIGAEVVTFNTNGNKMRKHVIPVKACGSKKEGEKN